MDLLATFLEGVATFVSPCLLPLLPVYLAFFAGDAAGAGGADGPSRPRALAGALAFVAGFGCVFTLLGAFAGTLGALLVAHRRTIELCCGLIVLAMGLVQLGVLRMPGWLGGGGLGARGGGGPAAAFALGIAFAVSWSPCVGVFLGSALSLAAAAGSAGRGVALLASYSLGLGVPLVLSALLVGELGSALAWVRGHRGLVGAASGGLLVVVGLLMASGLWGRWLALLA